MGNRIAPSFTNVTTAGFDKESYCYTTLRETGIKILEGTVIDETQIVLIYEPDEKDDWRDETIWLKANPDIPFSTTKMPNLRKNLIKAINEGGSTEVNFKTKNLNIWVDAPITFIPTEVWDLNSHGLQVDSGAECYGGLEVAPSGEMSAFALLFPGEKIKIKMLFFLAEDTLKSSEVYRANKDIIKIDPGNIVDNEVAIGWLVDEIQKYSMNSFCFDSKQANNDIVQGLIKLGYQGNPVSQGLAGIANATDEWEKMIRSGQVEHFNNPVLRWQNSNCMAVRKEAGTRLEKNGKVRGIWACIDAVAQWKTIAAEGGSEVGILYI
jgi:phage terminase large subunit-like protein